jgi:hypothetical protein
MDCDNCFSPKDVNVYYKNQKSHLSASGKWTDELFPPNKFSLMAQDKYGNFIDPVDGPNESYEVDENAIEWKRAAEIFPDGFKVFDKIEFDDIVQGGLGNCYFLSAIAAMCEFPGLVEDIFKTKESNDKGYYEVALFIDGVWNIVPIDDYFPVLKGTTQFAFTRTHGKELWVIILEKAWAKVNGGYVNIVGGISSDPFTTLTSFPCDNVKHSNDTLDHLWENILSAEQHGDIMCTATDADEDKQKAVGLVPGHAYTCIGAKAVNYNGKNIRLLRIRNPWGEMEWKGDYSDKSRLWTPELKEKFGWTDIDDGAFWMSIEDFIHYYDITSICYILYDDHVKNFKITGKQLKEPNVYNLNLKEHARVTFSAFKKHWRFNREIRDKNHPFSIVICKYDPQTKALSEVNGEFESIDHTEFTITLDPGHYAVWTNYAYDAADDTKLDNIGLRVTSHSDFAIEYVGSDKDCILVREMILTGCKELYANEMKTEKNFIDIQNSYKDTGIGYVFCSNISQQKMKVSADVTGVVGYHVLPPYNNNSNNITLEINPDGVHLLIGMRTCSYGSYGFCVETGYSSSSKDGAGKKTLADVSKFLKDLTNSKIEYDFCFDVLHKNHVGKFNNHSEVREAKKKGEYQATLESKKVDEPKKAEPKKEETKKSQDPVTELTKLFPDLMNKLSKLPKASNDQDLQWKNCNWKNAYYVGQIDKNNKVSGKGAYVEQGVQTSICQWVNGKKQGSGAVYDSKGNLYYEGQFENDKFNGIGKNYFNNGDSYEGQFRDGVFNGNGCYYWASGASWEGNFSNDKMHGNGVYTDAAGRSSNVEFYNGKQQFQNNDDSYNNRNVYQTKNVQQYYDQYEDDSGSYRVERKVYYKN